MKLAIKNTVKPELIVIIEPDSDIAETQVELLKSMKISVNVISILPDRADLIEYCNETQADLILVRAADVGNYKGNKIMKLLLFNCPNAEVCGVCFEDIDPLELVEFAKEYPEIFIVDSFAVISNKVKKSRARMSRRKSRNSK